MYRKSNRLLLLLLVIVGTLLVPIALVISVSANPSVLYEQDF